MDLIVMENIGQLQSVTFPISLSVGIASVGEESLIFPIWIEHFDTKCKWSGWMLAIWNGEDEVTPAAQSVGIIRVKTGIEWRQDEADNDEGLSERQRGVNVTRRGQVTQKLWLFVTALVTDTTTDLLKLRPYVLVSTEMPLSL